MRFIPTPVGNTAALLTLMITNPVHPHACGEHNTIAQLTADANGSSPRLWGTLEVAEAIRDGERFIPTPVGNTPPP